jgi:hypothetical protein
MDKRKKEITSIGIVVIIGVVIGLIALAWTKIGGSILILISLLIAIINKNLKDFLIDFFSKMFKSSNGEGVRLENKNSHHTIQQQGSQNRITIINKK